MPRRSLLILSTLSLLLSTASTALWIRSHYRADAYAWHSPDHVTGLRSNRGSIHLITIRSIDPMRYPFDASAVPAGHQTTPPDTFPPPFPAKWQSAGFSHHVGTAFALNLSQYTIPHWSITLLFALLPSVYFPLAIRRRLRQRLGHCPHCGYDLRATPNRCPECGAAADAPKLT